MSNPHFPSTFQSPHTKPHMPSASAQTLKCQPLKEKHVYCAPHDVFHMLFFYFSVGFGQAGFQLGEEGASIGPSN